jgi:hypothetical protein
MANHGPVYGLDADLKAKRDSSYDPNLEKQAREFVESMTGEKIGPNFHEGLKNGVLLCKLINKISPGKIKKINTGNMPFLQMENIGSYLSACSQIGIVTHDLFQTVDLYEAKNMNQVVQNILAVKRLVKK